MKKGTVLPLNVNPGVVPFYFAQCISESNRELSWLLPLNARSSAQINGARTLNGYDFLKSKAEYALLLDSDMIWKPSDIVRLRRTARELDAKFVSGLYFGQQMGRIIPMAYGLVEGLPKPFAKLPHMDRPFQVDGVGGGAALVHRDVYEAVLGMTKGTTGHMWQEEVYDPEHDVMWGQDLVFSLRAKAAGFDVWLEPRAIFGHLAKPSVVGLRHHEAFLETLGSLDGSTEGDNVSIPA